MHTCRLSCNSAGFGGFDKQPLLQLSDARIEIHGRKLQRTWTLLSKTVVAGETVLHLKHGPAEMGWQVGDRTAWRTSDGRDGASKMITDAMKEASCLEKRLYTA